MSMPDDIRKKLCHAIELAGSQQALGEQIGVSGPFISMMLSGKKQISDKVLAHLGYERIVIYRRLK